ncbi:MAG: hypothetical protein ACKO96_04845 [Flammeovirgaceae bacterium]
MIAFILYLVASITIGCFLGRKLKKTFAPDQFKGEWYQYLTNQLAHITLGLALYITLMLFHQVITGEFYDKILGWIIIFISYTCFELCQNGKSRDIIEDIIFVVGIGSGSGLVFKWQYETYVCGHVNYLTIFFYVATIILTYGVIKRLNYGKSSNK